ncbi:MAG: hypothetical protein M0030_11475 [Actinomycetota bacterium]|nr:hypothetical protein [Actinomycetota bacterium]
MATGPEHYQQAEQLLAEYRQQLAELIEHGGGWISAPPVLIEAQVHAALAQVAADALRWSVTGRNLDPQCKAWAGAIGTDATTADARALDEIAGLLDTAEPDPAAISAAVRGTGRTVAVPAGRHQVACVCCDVRDQDDRDQDDRDQDTECHDCGHLWRDHKGR